jgi:hypothetical protein
MEIDLMTFPCEIKLITEATPIEMMIDEFGEEVEIFQIETISVKNDSENTWNVSISKEGSLVYSTSIPVGLTGNFYIPQNKRFNLNETSFSVSR